MIPIFIGSKNLFIICKQWLLGSFFEKIIIFFDVNCKYIREQNNLFKKSTT